MTFAHPLLLAAGLASIALPILIHILMRRRRRPMRWGAMRFLLEAYKRQRRRVRLEQILLLLARCAIVALAALAIARPLIPGGDALLGSRATTLYLVIDNSLTASHGAPEALEGHRRAALALLERLDPIRGDRAALVTLAGPAAGVVSPPSSVLQAVGASVRDVAPAESAADLHGALARVAADISQDSAPGARSVVVVLSEFRAGSSRIDRPLPTIGETADLALAALTPATSAVDNIAITRVEPLRPIVLGAGDASTTQVRVRAARFGPGVAVRAEVPVELAVGPGRIVARGMLVFDPGARDSSVALGVDGAALGDLRRDGPGPVLLTARLGAGDAIGRDNVRRAVIERRESLLVGLVAPRRFGPRPSVTEYRAADWIETALDPESLREGGEIRVQGIDPAAVDAAALAGLEAVVVAEPQGVSAEGWSALRRFADLGGLVVLFPQPGVGAQVWTDAAIAAMDVAWELPREGLVVGGEVAPAGGPSPGAAPTVVGRLARPEALSPLLSMVEGELADLVRPVGVVRAMPVGLRAGGDDQLLLTLEDGRPIAVAAAPGSRGVDSSGAESRGLVVYVGLAMDLAWSDLPTKPLLLPLVQEVVRQGASAARGGWVVEAGEAPIAGAGAVELAWDGPGGVPAGAMATVPLQPSGLARQAIRHAGVYRGIDGSGASRGLVIVNPAASASDTETRSERDVGVWLETAGAGRPLWLDGGVVSPELAGGEVAGVADTHQDWSWLPVLFGLALALAVVEAIAARAFSHAPAQPAKGVA